VLPPALSAASPDLADGLHESSRSATGGVRTRRLRRTLVVVETALALGLLVGAGVLLRTLLVMRSTPPGFDASKVLVSQVWLPQPRFESPARRAAYYDTLLERAGTLAGAESSALVADLPLGGPRTIWASASWAGPILPAATSELASTSRARVTSGRCGSPSSKVASSPRPTGPARATSS
jgi:hypothetical protein